MKMYDEKYMTQGQYWGDSSTLHAGEVMYFDLIVRYQEAVDIESTCNPGRKGIMDPQNIILIPESMVKEMPTNNQINIKDGKSSYKLNLATGDLT